MMRTVEVVIAIIIIAGAFVGVSYFAVLPSPNQVSPVNLKRLSLTTLEMLDSNHALSQAAFDTDNATLMNQLQVALSASLPPNVLYNLTVYNVNSNQDGATLYTAQESMSNAKNLGVTSDASSYLVASSNVTFDVTPQKIGETNGGGGITLYILDCSDTERLVDHRLHSSKPSTKPVQFAVAILCNNRVGSEHDAAWNTAGGIPVSRVELSRMRLS